MSSWPTPRSMVHFDARAGEIKIKLTRSGALVNCVVLDNGSRSARGGFTTETSDQQ